MWRPRAVETDLSLDRIASKLMLFERRTKTTWYSGNALAIICVYLKIAQHVTGLIIDTWSTE